VRTDGTVACWGDADNGRLGAVPSIANAPPGGTFGTAYEFQFVDGAAPAAAYQLVSGSLPDGLSLSDSGEITGTPTTGGTTSFTVRAQNLLGSDTKTFTIQVAGGTAPDTTITLTPASPNGNNGWYTSPVQVTVTASDADDPVVQTRCVLDPVTAPVSFDQLGSGCAYTTGGMNVSADGTHTIYAASADSNHNQDQVRSARLQIDRTPPTLSCRPAPLFALRAAGATVTASVADQTSGPSSPTVSASASTATAGAASVSLTGYDNAGNSTTVNCPYTVAAAPPTPQLTALKLTPRAFRAATRGPAVGGGPETGATISYQDTLPAQTTFRVLRCAGPHGRCTRLTLIGSFSHRDHAGRNRLHFTGRLNRRALSPEQYMLSATAAHTGRVATATFVILAPPPVCHDPDDDRDCDAPNQN
jgi:hypothetical protein